MMDQSPEADLHGGRRIRDGLQRDVTRKIRNDASDHLGRHQQHGGESICALLDRGRRPWGAGVSDTAAAPAIVKNVTKLVRDRKPAARNGSIHRMIAINDDRRAQTVTGESGSAWADILQVL